MALTTLKKRWVILRDQEQCVICKTQDNLTVDHIIPVSRGGTNEMNNLQTLCQQCNRQKGNISPLDHGLWPITWGSSRSWKPLNSRAKIKYYLFNTDF